jgi:subtilisin family serine protease
MLLVSFALSVLSDVCMASPIADRELLVLFKPGVVNLPPGSFGGTVDEANITSLGLEDALSSVAIDSIISAAPAYDRADTVAVGPTGEPVYFLDYSLLYRLRLPEGANRDSIAGVLSQFPEVVYAELNGVGTAFGPKYPNDVHFVNGDQWGLWNRVHANADVDAPWAWGTTTGLSTIKIGIIDTGFDASHDEFLNRLSPRSNTSAPDPSGHGFQVAGVLGATGSNGTGIAGMDWNAILYSGRFDFSDNTTALDIQTAAAEDTAWVLNMSFGLGHGGAPRTSITIGSALAGAYMLNRNNVAAMGNDCGPLVNFPAGFGHGMIAVGATNAQDLLDPCSTTGPNIDVVAPGVGIWTCDKLNSYTQVSGTSFAAPVVSGIAALLKSAADSLANDDIRAIIRLSARDLGNTPGWDPETGMGRVNARRALEIFRSPNLLVRGRTGPEANPTDVGNDGPGRHLMKLIAGTTSQTYYVVRHEIRGHLQFPTPFLSKPYVWGRGAFMERKGSSDYTVMGNDTVHFYTGWCDTVPGTISTSGCSLKTYVYQLWQTRDGNPDLYFWWPCTPSEVRFAWSALEVKSYPDSVESFYVPQAVVSGSVVEGPAATQYFLTCPNTDGTQVLKNSARIKVVVKDAGGVGIAGISASDVFILLNGGTQPQGLIGEGADSVIANSQWNPNDNCPDLRVIPADGPTDATGTSFITFIGAGGQRDSTRKWGHYDSTLPIYVLGTRLSGRAYTDPTSASYSLTIRNVDTQGGLTASPNVGEVVNALDRNPVITHIANGTYLYWLDYDESGDVNQVDLNFVTIHFNHRCRTPNVH